MRLRSILAALLLPALNKTKEQGRATLCRNNMRQIGLGIMLYADDNENFFPWAGDFNVNLFPHNRIATNEARPDPSRILLLDKLKSLYDTQALAACPSLQTFSQNTKNNNHLLTKLDYIFLSETLALEPVHIQTLAGNSDHLLLLATIGSKIEPRQNPQWKLNTRTLNEPGFLEQTAGLFDISQAWDEKKADLTSLLQDFSRKTHNKKSA